MLCNSFVFILIYLPVVVAGFFWFGYLNHKLAAGWLALVSLIFYGYWDYQYIPLLLGSIGFNFLTARKIWFAGWFVQEILACFRNLDKSIITWLFQICGFFSKFDQLDCRV